MTNLDELPVIWVKGEAYVNRTDLRAALKKADCGDHSVAGYEAAMRARDLTPIARLDPDNNYSGAKWRANERADRAEAELDALREAARALLACCPTYVAGAMPHGPFVDAADALRALLGRR